MKKEDYEITLSYADLKHLKAEIEFEIKEYEGQTNDEFVTLHDSTVYQIMMIINMLIGQSEGQMATKTPSEIIKETP